MSTPTAGSVQAADAALPSNRADILPSDWATALLIYIGAPVTTNNVTKIEDWIASESAGSAGGWLHDNNPLNTGTGTGGGGGTGGAATVVDGVEDAGDTITAGDYGYPAIYENLLDNGPESSFIVAVSHSSWAGGHYASDPSNPSTWGDQFHTGGFDQSAGGPGVVGQFEGLLGSDVQSQLPVQAGEAAAGSAGSVVSGITGVAQGELKVLEDVTSAGWWKRVGLGVLGVGLFIVGLVIFLASTKTGSKAVTDAETAGIVAAAA